MTQNSAGSSGSWDNIRLFVEYTELRCEFVEAHRCEMVQYRDELDVLFLDVDMVGGGKQNNDKRYFIYRGFTWIKYCALGSKNRRKVDDCVEELIYQTFPVEIGKRKGVLLIPKIQEIVRCKSTN